MARTTDIPEMSWRAVYRFARLSPRKARPVVDMIRGKECGEALNMLQFNPKRPAVEIAKTIRSAMANAYEGDAEVGRLYISEARVDAGPTSMRWRPKDRGRAHPILKKTAHIHIAVSELI